MRDLRTWHVVVPSAVALPEGTALGLFHRDYDQSGGTSGDPHQASGFHPSHWGPEQPLEDPVFSKMYELRSKHPEIAQTIFSNPAVVSAIVEQRVPIVRLNLSCHVGVVTLASALGKNMWQMREYSSPEHVRSFAEHLVVIMQAVEQALAFEGDTAAAKLSFRPHEYGYPVWTRS